MITAPDKDPNATLDYSLDWTAWLSTGETVTAYSVTAPAGITKVSDGEEAGIVKWRLSGGTDGEDYDVVVTVTSSVGQQDERTVRVPVRER